MLQEGEREGGCGEWVSVGRDGVVRRWSLCYSQSLPQSLLPKSNVRAPSITMTLTGSHNLGVEPSSHYRDEEEGRVMRRREGRSVKLGG